jgi:hypothetical protein
MATSTDTKTIFRGLAPTCQFIRVSNRAKMNRNTAVAAIDPLVTAVVEGTVQSKLTGVKTRT